MRLLMAFINHYTLQCFTATTNAHISSLHLSLKRLLWKHLLEPLIPPTCSFLLQLAIWCFMLHASRVDGRSIHISTSTSFESSLLLTLKILGSSPILISSVLAPQWSFTGALVFRFVSIFFFSSHVKWSSSPKERKLAAGFDPSTSELVATY